MFVRRSVSRQAQVVPSYRHDSFASSHPRYHQLCPPRSICYDISEEHESIASYGECYRRLQSYSGPGLANSVETKGDARILHTRDAHCPPHLR